MAKNTTIFILLQNFISQEEIDGILAEFGFEDTARICFLIFPFEKKNEDTGKVVVNIHFFTITFDECDRNKKPFMGSLF